MLPITVLFPEQGESVAAFERRIAGTPGDLIVIFSDLEDELLQNKEARKHMFSVCKKYGTRLRVATHNHILIAAARPRGIRVVHTVADLKKLLAGNPSLDDALREFQPQIWRQQLRNRLQSMGLLSLPKLRIWALIGVSSVLFFFVVFRLLPSATVRVWPQEESVSQTVNIFLAQSGAIAALPPRVRVMALVPVSVRAEKTITFDQISKEFIGKNAVTVMSVHNDSTETYWLKSGSRLRNQAGMNFKILQSIKIDPATITSVKAEAEPEDVYGNIVGIRGNVPAGLQWYFTGLTKEEQILVYAENTEPGTGGKSAFRRVLQQKDLDIAKKKLEQELLTQAKQMIAERKALMNVSGEYGVMDLLYYDELTKSQYVDFSLPTQYLGTNVDSVPVQGSLLYTMYAYDTQAVLDMLSKELRDHVGEGRRLLEKTLNLSHLVAHVIDYSDDFSWIKVTVDLSGTEQYILDPLSPTGAVFAKKVRENIKDINKNDAESIVGNYPEVRKALVHVWPPWVKTLPSIPSSIVVEPVLED